MSSQLMMAGMRPSIITGSCEWAAAGPLQSLQGLMTHLTFTRPQHLLAAPLCSSHTDATTATTSGASLDNPTGAGTSVGPPHVTPHASGLLRPMPFPFNWTASSPSIPHTRSLHTSTPVQSTWANSKATPPSSKRPGAGGKADVPLLAYESEALAKLTPSAVVERLNRHIIGQDDAKKAVAVAFRNRWRRHRVSPELREDITPKNILMIGPTGCGKTEIARRLAKLADAPFIKVEATKFTEVGYVGRDVDSIIKDLVEASISLVRNKLRQQAQAALDVAVETRLVVLLATQQGSEGISAAASWAASGHNPSQMPAVLSALRERLRAGELEKQEVEVDVSTRPNLDLNNLNNQAPGLERLLSGLMSGMGGRREHRRMRVSAARAALEEQEVERMFPQELVQKEAVRLAEQDGIVFIDEIDKIVPESSGTWKSGDPSSDGVQRDLLPLIEGSTVSTKYGNVNTDHMLFICAGAFHHVKPSELMPELQGRLPIRVELKALTQHDFYRILTEPQYNLIKQQQMLLGTEGVDLHFTDAAIREVARLSEDINKSTENIGARRLGSVLERCVEQISFSAPELASQAKTEGRDKYHVVLDKENVEEHVSEFLKKQDFAKWII